MADNIPKRIRVRAPGYLDIELGVDDVISNLQKLKTKLTREGWSNLRLQLDEVAYCESSHEVNVYGERMETQDEANDRAQRERTRANMIRERDLRELEALKKKYES